MPPEPHSNIRVFVRWHEPTVFAGEELKCTITFKNVAQTQQPREPGPGRGGPTQLVSRTGAHASSVALAHHRKAPSGLTPPPSAASAARGHRTAQSLSVPTASSARSRRRSGSPTAWTASAAAHSDGAVGPLPPADGSGSSRRHGHTRSISVLSIGSTGTAATYDELASIASSRSHRSQRGHSRHSSLQLTSSKGQSVPMGPMTGPFSPRHSGTTLSPTSPDLSRPTAPNTPTISEPHGATSAFRFPPLRTPTAENGGTDGGVGHDVASPFSISEETMLATRLKDLGIPVINEYAAPPAKIVAASTFAGTPRSSTEFYSMSNHSSETLVSEYVMAQPGRGQARPLHLRRSSGYTSQNGKLPEHLMMGYAQVHGSFILDGSLVSLSPFEDVKKKAVVGGQGGGVIGIETSKNDGGLLRGFGWSSIGNSLGELLGGGELSTIKEMRGLASSKSVPLLSSPQSILFVDLHLAPGETRVFEYSFRLPRGLPPTHKGKAIKISYGLVIGTQRPGGAREQHVRSVEVPFRVLSSVNGHGELLGHELMSPYVLLRDQAQITSMPLKASARKREDKKSSETLADFVGYVDRLLLDRKRTESGAAALLSPTATAAPSRRTSFLSEEPTTAKEAIHLAILRSNLASQGQQSPNRFEIARSGQRVAVVMLARPAYKLGEAVTVAVDFADADVPTYAVHFALESSERIEHSLALRSEASVHRVTRRVHAFASEATLFSRRAVFTPTIPITATPDFVTSGVSLEWKVRIEFVVPTMLAPPPVEAHHNHHNHHNHNHNHNHHNPPSTPKANTHDNNDDDDGDADAESYHNQNNHHHHHSNHNNHHQRERSLSATTATPTTTASAPAAHMAPALLEQVSRDEKGGTVMVAAENVVCESFEVPVPLRVYGAVGTGLERLDRDEAVEYGLAV